MELPHATIMTNSKTTQAAMVKVYVVLAAMNVISTFVWIHATRGGSRLMNGLERRKLPSQYVLSPHVEASCNQRTNKG